MNTKTNNKGIINIKYCDDSMKEQEELFIKAKMGIIPEVSSQNYETIAKQIREPIANSIDAHATTVNITLQPDGNYTDLIIKDNGMGMNEKEFKDQFLALGGSEKYYLEKKIGRIGIGFMACAPLCRSIEIRTRKQGSNELFFAEIDVLKLFDKSLRTNNIEKIPIGKITKIIENPDDLDFEKHFTMIILRKLNDSVIEEFNDKESLKTLREQLARILPLPYPPNSRVFNFIPENLKEHLIELSNQFTVEVFLNGEKIVKSVYGELPDENIDYIMPIFKESPRTTSAYVSGYLIQTSSPDNRKKSKRIWHGLLTRFQNVAVEDSGFLDFDQKLPALAKTTGELFLVGLNKITAITINRNNFNVSDPGFFALRKLIYSKLERFCTTTYKRSYIASEINKEIRQTIDIKENLQKATKLITQKEVKPKKSVKKTTQSKITKKVSKKTKSIKEKISLDSIDTKRYGEIEVVSKDTNKKGKRNYKIKWSGEDGTKAKVEIDKELIKKAGEDIVLENKKYKVFFVNNLNDIPCRIDEANSEINFNIEHPLIKKKNSDIITIIFILTYFEDKFTSVQKYKEKILEIISKL